MVYCRVESSRQLLHKLLPADWPPLFQSPPASAGMAGDGELRRLFQTFMKLKRSCQHAEVNFNSDRDGVCQVVLRVTTPGTGFQSPCRGGAQSRSQERKGSGARNPPTPPTAAAPAPAPGPAPAPAPAPGPAPRRARRRGPGALLRDERRRLARIEPGLLEPEVEVEGGPALPHAALIASLLDPSERTPALSPAPREEATAPYCPAPAPLSPARSLAPREGAPARPGPRPIVILANRRKKCTTALPP